MSQLDRSEITIGAEDLDDIFGMGNPQSISQMKEQKQEELEKSGLVVTSKIQGVEPEGIPDELPEDVHVKMYTVDFKGETDVLQVLEISEGVADAVRQELLRSVPEKAVDNMMLKTLEKTALEHSLLKNTNWDSNGKLKSDGAMDLERALMNVRKTEEREEEIIASALSSLLSSRFAAIEKGAGREKYLETAEAVKRKINIIAAGYKKNNVEFYRGEILDPVMKKGDE